MAYTQDVSAADRWFQPAVDGSTAVGAETTTSSDHDVSALLGSVAAGSGDSTASTGAGNPMLGSGLSALWSSDQVQYIADARGGAPPQQQQQPPPQQEPPAPYETFGNMISHAIGTVFGGTIGEALCGPRCALAGGSLGYDATDHLPKTGNGHSEAAERGANARFGNPQR